MDFRVMTVERRDLPELNAVMEEVDFSVGLENLEIFYDCSNGAKNWVFVRISGNNVSAVLERFENLWDVNLKYQ